MKAAVDVEQCPDHSLRTLLQYASASDIEVEDLVSLVNAIVIHLKHDRFQNLLISQDLVNLPLQIIIQSFSPQASSSSSLSITDLMPLPRDPEEEEQIAAVRSALIRALSDVSAVPKFATQYPIRSPLVKSLLLWLPAPQAEFQICSSIMLGNLARSDIICHSMVHDLRIHEILAATIRESSDLQVLHSALGFLRNLALPIDNKHLLGTAQTIELTSRFWSLDFSPQLQYAAVSLTRQLLSGSIANIQLILTSLSLDPDSPAHEKTYLSLLLALFEKTDQEPARLEISRTIAAIWRCLYASDNSTDSGRLNTTLHRLLSMHGSIGTPIATMVSQSRWPVVRSEGWFALALMARSREGSAAVNVLLQQVEVFGALVETVTGQPIGMANRYSAATAEAGASTLIPEHGEATVRPDQETEMKARDRENAMVLINELLKNSVRIGFHDLSIRLDATLF